MKKKKAKIVGQVKMVVCRKCQTVHDWKVVEALGWCYHCNNSEFDEAVMTVPKSKEGGK